MAAKKEAGEETKTETGTRTPYLLPVYEYRSAIMAMEMLTVRLMLL